MWALGTPLSTRRGRRYRRILLSRRGRVRAKVPSRTNGRGTSRRRAAQPREVPMLERSSIGAAVLAAALCMSVAGAKAEDAKKYPDWEALWNRGSPPGAWDPSKPPGRGQQAPLTPEYQAVHEANLAKQKAGVEFDPKATCGPVGMPRVMTMYEPMELVIKPKVTYMLVESMSPIRRIFTDGRDWAKNAIQAYTGYSIGKWRGTGKATT